MQNVRCTGPSGDSTEDAKWVLEEAVEPFGRALNIQLPVSGGLTEGSKVTVHIDYETTEVRREHRVAA